MSVQLLDKTRKINKLLHNNHSTKVVFNDICEVLMETLSSNILVISKKGKVLVILGAEDKLVSLEYDLFCQVRDQIAGEVNRIQSTARAIAMTDVLASLSVVATRYN